MTGVKGRTGIESRPYPLRVRGVGSVWASAARAPISAPTMRRSNAFHVLDALRRRGRATRSDLAHDTGLTMATVHRAMAELEQMRLIGQKESPPPTPGSGRRPTWYAFEPTVATTVGIDVGNETTRVALALADGTIVHSRAVATAQIAADLADSLLALIAELRSADRSELGPLAGAGVGIAAAVDPATGKIVRASQHRMWDQTPLRDMLQDALSCPVTVEQDDHLAALAEISEQGGARNATTAVVVNAGKGIGVGLIAEGRMLRGAHGASGRIAYWPTRIQDSAGNALGDTLVADGLARLYVIRGGTGQIANGLDLCSAAANGDVIAEAVVAEVSAALADVFLRLASVFDPEVMILGGGLSNSFDLFAPTITQALGVLPNAIPLVRSPLGEDAVILGSLIEAGRYIDGWLEAQIPSNHNHS